MSKSKVQSLVPRIRCVSDVMRSFLEQGPLLAFTVNVRTFSDTYLRRHSFPLSLTVSIPENIVGFREQKQKNSEDINNDQ